MSADRKLSLYNGPSASLAATSNQEDRENDHDDALLVGKPISEVRSHSFFSIIGPKLICVSSPQIIEHDKDDCHMLTSQSIEWLLTWSKDGFFTVRNLMESDHATRVLGHDSFQGGIKAATLISAGQCIVTLGRDGLVKAWRWKYSAIGKRQAAEAVSEFARMISVKEKDLRDLSIKINLIPVKLRKRERYRGKKISYCIV